MIKLTEMYIQELVERALEEDIGSGDITTSAIITDDIILTAELVFKSDWGVFCGKDFFEKTFLTLDSKAEFVWEYNEGDEIKGRCNVSRIEARADALLSAERTALNFVAHLSGIATNTRRYVKRVLDRVKVLDTRKTTPLLRLAEKYAVGVGGGTNHRLGLYDGILIKDNHIRIAGGISNAIDMVRRNVNSLQKVEVEVSNLDELEEAIMAGADIIMLDNMSEDEIRKAIKIVNKRAEVEISGGVLFEDINMLAKYGADYISIGALTHHAVWLDFSLEIITDNI
ncbi:MAG: carboxylating nicotinate-nucleotide diphosphorylase [bacterium]